MFPCSPSCVCVCVCDPGPGEGGLLGGPLSALMCVTTDTERLEYGSDSYTLRGPTCSQAKDNATLNSPNLIILSKFIQIICTFQTFLKKVSYVHQGCIDSI